MRIISTAILLIQRARELLHDPIFLKRHRANDKAFTRQRKLRFDLVVLLVLQKSLKSLQLHLHEFFAMLKGTAMNAASASALTQARAKLLHTAFIELNEVAVLASVYAAGEPVATWRGHRLLAIDSSLVRMPDSEPIFEFFGGQEPFNQSGDCGMRVPQCRLSVLYDVLNRVGIDTRVGKLSRGEVDLASDHLGALLPNDLLASDRGYAGYLHLAKIEAGAGHFVVRCQKQSFEAAKKLFRRNEHGASITVTLHAKSRSSQAKAAGLPLQMRVRFVSVRLPTGELEVLVTNLLDEVAYPTLEFLDLYHQRWGIETYYGVLKGRLDLENFSGLTVESVLQDIHAAVFLSNIESVVTREAASKLPQAGDNGRLYGSQINRAVSFNALKNRVIDLLLSKKPLQKVLAELTAVFLANPVSIRPARKPPRETPSPARSLNFQKRLRKIVF